MANPDWPAPMMTVVVHLTSLAPWILPPPSVDGDEDVRRVGDDVEYGRPFLRLGDQRLDVVLARIGADVEMNADRAETIAHLVVHAEDALNIHVRLKRGLD